MKKNTKVAETVGWYGTGAIITAYALVSFGVLQAESLGFQLLNLTGAAGIIVISSLRGVKQSVVLNGFWAIIALVAILSMVLR